MSSTNGAFVMSLRHDSVVVAFSDSIRESVKKELRESTKDQDSATSAIGDMIQGVVQKSVAATMTEVFDKARGFPVSALRDVQYEDGGIRFDYIKKPTWTFDSMKSDDGPLMEQFHPADAARFVGAVRARMRK